MDIEEFKEEADELINQLDYLINKLPEKGDVSENCQRTFLQERLNALSYAFNGTEQNDLLEVEDEVHTKNGFKFINN